MRKTAIVALLAAAGCASGPPAHEVMKFPAYTYRDPGAVREACRAALREERCPIETDNERELASPIVDDVGFTWKLTVALRPEGEGLVTVEPSLDLRRSADYEPTRKRTRSVSPYDDPMSRSANRDGSLAERQMAPRPGGDAMNERENRIRELERRVNRFVDAVGQRLASKP
jgi:hypothetical protein